MPRKDCWDKAEIFGKVALPLVIAAATLTINSQINARQNQSAIVSMALGIVSEKPDPEDAANVDPLRLWAIDRLVEHGGLSEAAATQLKFEALPNYGGIPTITSSFGEPSGGGSSGSEGPGCCN